MRAGYEVVVYLFVDSCERDVVLGVGAVDLQHLVQHTPCVLVVLGVRQLHNEVRIGHAPLLVVVAGKFRARHVALLDTLG